MAYAAVTSLMETLSLHFLQLQARFPLEDLEEQIRDGNENLGLLQQILQIANDEVSSEVSARLLPSHGIFNNQEDVGDLGVEDVEDLGVEDPEDLAVELDEASSKGWTKRFHRPHGIFNNEAVKQTEYYPKKKKKKLIKSEKLQMREMELDEEASSKAWKKRLLRIKACFRRPCGKQQLASRLREMAEVKQRIVSLHQNLGLLQQSLEKSEIAYDDAKVMKDLEAQIRDASFKLEEMIEMELSAIYLAKDSRLHVTACLLRLHQNFKEAQKQTDYHMNELIRIQTHEYQVSLLGRIRRRGLLLVKGGGSSQPDLSHNNNIVTEVSKNSSKFDGGMVGCDKLFENILDQLLTQQTTKGRQVVSIVGMGGIGKTTLAHKLYEHPSITSHFDKRAWVTISQKYNMGQMLRCLTGCVIAASRDELHKQSTDQLADRLRKHLKGERYLIVIDDIWSKEAWDSVQICFPDDNNGSRILLTSRLKEVAEYASSGNSPVNMPFLDANESWNLYCNVFGKTEFDLVFEQIGRDIVKKCEGLPIAITVVASLLSKTQEVEEKWKNVAKGVIGNSNDACSRILYLSYNQLPHHLKTCFLYFGVFRENYEIPVKKLIRLWAAEGFLRAAVGMECLQDLVDRSLVIVSKQKYNGKIKRIRIHDLFRDLCVREARRENLLNVIGEKKLPFHNRKSQHLFSKPYRWISFPSGCVNNKSRSRNKCFQKSHSIHSSFDYSTDLYFKSYVHLGQFSHFKLLRVVDIECGFSNEDRQLNVPETLVHLRYCALTYKREYCEFPLYVNLFGHWNMQSFIVRGNFVILDSSRRNFVGLDSSEECGIWKMPLLKNFCVEQIFSLKPCLDVHRNLESISWLVPELCRKDLFTKIPNLKKLGIEGRNGSPYCFYNFVHLEHLETLSIRRWHALERIPCDVPWATSFLPNLKKLKFHSTPNLLWSEMRLIGMLPNLEVLKLIYACQGPKWEPYNGGFRRLKTLVIEDTLVKYWNAGGDHFPVLKCLQLRSCLCLQEIPSDFVDITTLALIQLNYCRESLLTSAKRIQEEQLNKYGNSNILVRSENIKPERVNISEEECDEEEERDEGEIV